LVPIMRELLHEVADGEVGRVALAAVAELLAEPQRLEVGAVERLDLIAEAVQRAGEQRVVREREAADQDGRRLALVPRERLRVGVVPVLDLLLLDAELLPLLGFEGFQFALDLFKVHHGFILKTISASSMGRGAISRRAISSSVNPAGVDSSAR